jgi:hypothetical protein
MSGGLPRAEPDAIATAVRLFLWCLVHCTSVQHGRPAGAPRSAVHPLRKFKLRHPIPLSLKMF